VAKENLSELEQGKLVGELKGRFKQANWEGNNEAIKTLFAKAKELGLLNNLIDSLIEEIFNPDETF